ncbi:MAG: hypothetical protein KatS3mg115_1661 [Candidatus Poribacteria bacterium]|nr:MAG: hypothetical protein KatS3mg115_1661 [Candidatus Poribacteria bacterium]
MAPCWACARWEAFVPRGAAARMGVVLGRLSRYLPRALFSRIKPPIRYAPPVDLFFTPAFGQLFPAEQYTLAPVFYLIEQHTSRRERVLEELIEWILARQDSEGSWFSVNFITALATLALRAAMEATPRPRLDRAYARAREWLEQTRNPDGGHREAADLNVWDTALSVLALLRSGMPARSAPIRRATDWLVSVQNLDGGWAFHGRRASDLLSDADDTALATWALLETGRHPVAAGRGVAWLADHQGKDGSWATYRPGVGDVGCVSVTARAIQVLAQVGERRRAERGLRWLRRVQANDGSWDDLWLARRTYGTAMALIAMARLDAFDRRTVERGIQWLLKHQRPDGGWGETQRGEPRSSTAEQTAFAVRALLAWGRSADRGLEWLLKHQRPDGGWDPAPIGIYWEVIGGYANPINGWVFPLLALSEEPEG